MSNVNFKRQIADTLERAIERVTKALGEQGFGILTGIPINRC
ncbi:MAG: hypothetical protein ACOYNZ_01280 [Rhodoferax sp.]